MLDHKEVLQDLVQRVNAGSSVRLRETNYGYAIRSRVQPNEGELRQRAARFSLSLLWVGAIGVWTVPASALFCTFASLALLAAGLVAYAALREPGRAIELHVDTGRREIRAAAFTDAGERWIRATVRFAEVAEITLRPPPPETRHHTLFLDALGAREPLPIAVGDAATLRALHRRLMTDLRPLEERIAGYRVTASATATPEPRKVFPEIGPDELGLT